MTCWPWGVRAGEMLPPARIVYYLVSRQTDPLQVGDTGLGDRIDHAGRTASWISHVRVTNPSCSSRFNA